MRDVVGHESRDEPGLDEATGDDDGDRSGIVHDVGAARAERIGDPGRHLVGDAERREQGDSGLRRPVRREHALQSSDDGVSAALRPAECARERFEGGTGDPSLEFAHEPQLPCLGIVERRGGVDAELQDRRRAPHGRMSRIDAEHDAILPGAGSAPALVHSRRGWGGADPSQTGR